MLKTEVTVNTKKWDKLKGELKDLKSCFTTCGLHYGETYSDGTSIPYIGSIQEFGVPDKSPPIPSRPFTRQWFDGNLAKTKNKSRKILENILDGNITVKEGLEELGFYGATGIKQSIVQLKKPPNAPMTIRKKGFDDPLIETGQMRDTVNHKEFIGQPFPKEEDDY